MTNGSHYQVSSRDRLTPRQEEILAPIDSRDEAVTAWRHGQGFGRRMARRIRALLAPLAVHKLAIASAAGAVIAISAGSVVIAALRSGGQSNEVLTRASTYQCPITVPREPYFAAAPYPRQPPDSYQAVWYGNDDLWTMLSPGGEVWGSLPKDGGSFSQKTFWWSRNFATKLGFPGISGELQPRIVVTGKRLDAPGNFSAGNPGTHAIADFGTAMLVGIDIPAAGCWEIRAQYKGAELAYIVRVDE